MGIAGKHFELDWIDTFRPSRDGTRWRQFFSVAGVK
jgi:hypothetical protein